MKQQGSSIRSAATRSSKRRGAFWSSAVPSAMRALIATSAPVPSSSMVTTVRTDGQSGRTERARVNRPACFPVFRSWSTKSITEPECWRTYFTSSGVFEA